MKARVKWAGDVMFVAESGSGHAVVLEGPPEQGGRNVGIRPMELLLMGVGGCSSYDVVSILRKSRQQVTDCVAELTAERADEVPAVFTKIHLHFIVTGHGLKEAQVKRAVELSAEKYCSASIMLGRAGVEVTHGYQIIELDSSHG
ncbi:MAG: OsmC family protein [Pseudomonadales bacterium]|jgi:putative redox protein|nr:OsmC family protein [Pseudomonadales bacterium]MCP5333697.1 OsmC family protein [Pseudomonadales bacterium]HMU90004.1 OsmC family protein [Pseudomonadales bacterium]HMW14876.1 OsmC family protein [Pseudomonadales bacterium]HMW83498.1 OsmC family protein [Pseudomonadales bacterium]